MKKVRIYNDKVDVTVIATYENLLTEDCPELDLKKGSDLGIFYRNWPHEYTYEKQVYYDKPYHPQEILNRLININPLVHVMMKKFDMELSI